MFNDNTASGERGKPSSRQTNTRMLFSAPPRSDIWGKVFVLSLWVSRGSASSSVWDKWKTFWLPLQGEECKQGGTVSYAEMPLTERNESKGENINKTISSYYNAVRHSIFIFALRKPASRFGSEWFYTAAFAILLQVFFIYQSHALWHSIISDICILK